MDSNLSNIITELRRGTLTLAVLSQLKQPQYGYSLLQLLEQKNINIDAGTLYPLLRRLELQNFLTSSWDTAESRPRKYYLLSDEGKDMLDRLTKEWFKLNNEMVELLKGENYER